MRRIYNGISGKNVLFGVTDISAHGHFGGMQVACLLWQRVCSEKFPSRTSLSGGFGKEAFLCVPLLLGSKRAVSPKCGHEPIVFFKLQLVMFFDGIRSERQLMQLSADRLSVRWYLGYDLNEPLPDHSSLTRIRGRYGIEIFRRFFEEITSQCQQAGLVWGRELYIDGTKVQANASTDSLQPRFFVEAHLAALFGAETDE